MCWWCTTTVYRPHKHQPRGNSKFFIKRLADAGAWQKTIQSTVLYKIKVKQAWTKSKMSAKTENGMVAYLYSMRIIKLRRNLLSALLSSCCWAPAWKAPHTSAHIVPRVWGIQGKETESPQPVKNRLETQPGAGIGKTPPGRCCVSEVADGGGPTNLPEVSSLKTMGS